MRTWIALAVLGLPTLVGCAGDRKGAPADPEPPKKDAQPDPPPVAAGKKEEPPKPAPAEERPKHVPPTPLEPTGEVTKLTSVRYGEEYQKDAEVATKRYEKKFLELTGRVTKVGRTTDGAPLLELEGAKDALLGVQCFTRDPRPWLTALPGQTVRLRGIGPQIAVGASLDRCDILEATGAKPPTLKAEELAVAYGKDAAGTLKKYQAGLLVEGEVLRVDAKEDEPTTLVLKTPRPGPAVFLRFATDGAEGKRAARFPAGQRVVAVGAVTAGQGGVGLADALVIDPAP